MERRVTHPAFEGEHQGDVRPVAEADNRQLRAIIVDAGRAEDGRELVGVRGALSCSHVRGGEHRHATVALGEGGQAGGGLWARAMDAKKCDGKVMSSGCDAPRPR
eukprot:scaffold84613_cov18-Prasinocladus_malaysianus.AAC.1